MANIAIPTNLNAGDTFEAEGVTYMVDEVVNAAISQYIYHPIGNDNGIPASQITIIPVNQTRYVHTWPAGEEAKEGIWVNDLELGLTQLPIIDPGGSPTNIFDNGIPASQITTIPINQTRYVHTWPAGEEAKEAIWVNDEQLGLTQLPIVDPGNNSTNVFDNGITATNIATIPINQMRYVHSWPAGEEAKEGIWINNGQNGMAQLNSLKVL